MRFLIDENLPRGIVSVFRTQGFEAEHVAEIEQLRSEPDEVVFDYAVRYGAVIVTRDLRFANVRRFPLQELPAMIVLRFPNEVRIGAVIASVERFLRSWKEEDFSGVIIVEPGAIRHRLI